MDTDPVNGDFLAPELLYGIGALVLVLSSLSLRRIGFGRFVKMLLTWALIFGVIFVAFSFRYELEPYWLRVKGELLGEPVQIVSGGEVRSLLGADNHYHARAMVNGKPIDMLIDTGASFTAMGTKRAQELGVEIEPNTFGHEIRTANGSIKAYPAKIAVLQVGDIEMRDVTIFVADEFDDVAILGMNFLSALQGYRVERNVMILQP